MTIPCYPVYQYLTHRWGRFAGLWIGFKTCLLSFSKSRQQFFVVPLCLRGAEGRAPVRFPGARSPVPNVPVSCDKKKHSGDRVKSPKPFPTQKALISNDNSKPSVTLPIPWRPLLDTSPSPPYTDQKITNGRTYQRFRHKAAQAPRINTAHRAGKDG